MKITLKHTHLAAAVVALLACISVVPRARAQSQNSVRGDSREARSAQDSGLTTVRVVRASDLVGTDVIGSDHRKVGDIVDYVFESREAPRLAYVLVMTGGFLDLGGDVRAVPAAALTLDGDTARVQLSSDRFHALPVLPANRTAFLSERRNAETLAREFGLTAQASPSNTSSGDNRSRSALLTFSELHNADANAAQGSRLGYIVDALISLNQERAPYLEIVPTFNPFRVFYHTGYAIPFARYAGPSSEATGFDFNVTSDDLLAAKPASLAEGVQLLEAGDMGNQILRVTLPRVASSDNPAATARGSDTAATRERRGDRDVSARTDRNTANRANAQGNRQWNSAGAARLEVASSDAVDSSARKFAGQHVRSSDGRDLGTIKDFVVNTQSGRLACAIVSSGGFIGVGDQLHIVPAAALQRGTGNEGFTIAIAQADWNRVPTVREEQFEEGRLALGDSERQRLREVFPGATDDNNQSNATLLRASKIRGKGVRSTDGDVGDIEEVVLDFNNRSARALIDPKSDFTGTDQKFLVPFARLDLQSREQDPVMTTLSRDDFRTAQRGSASAATSSGDSASPTGRSSAEQNPTMSAGMSSAARAVREAIDRDPTLASANIRVVPQDEKLVLRGSVSTDELHDRAESVAERAANGVDVNNELSVRNE
jgi:sporulation protein YlmC with PRC-barrel domain